MPNDKNEFGHRIPHDCIKEAEVKEVRKLSETDATQEEKSARINALFARAGKCPYCRRAILVAFSR